MGDRIRTIIVDDNDDSLEIMQFYIDQLPDFYIVDKCHNGEELVDSIMKAHPDVVLLDINMPIVNGLDAIQSCLRIKNNLLFVFITSYDEYAVKAFELSAIDYVVKPIEKTRLYSALEKVRKSINSLKLQGQPMFNHSQRLYIRDSNDYYYIPVEQILFIEKVGKKCHVYTIEKEYTTIENIGDLLNQLPENLFYLSHRSYIVNLTKVTHISTQNQTYIAYFPNTNKYAHISKLKIEEMHNKLKPFDRKYIKKNGAGGK